MCGLAGLCYAEFASTVPVAGSAYTFSYASLGELVAWIIGWDLILEMVLGAASSRRAGRVLRGVHVVALARHPADWIYGGHLDLVAPRSCSRSPGLLCIGIKKSSRVNLVLVAIKLASCCSSSSPGMSFIHSGNYHPFIPPAQAAAGREFRVDAAAGPRCRAPSVRRRRHLRGAALVFFAFIGFDVVATTAEETRKPQRDLPIGIFGSLAICTVLYVAVSLVVTGMVKYDQIDVKAPLATAFQSVGQNTIATIISYGALAGLTSVVLVLLMGQSRVFFAMSRDRLLPAAFSTVSERFGTPYRTTIVTGFAVALVTFLFPLKVLAEMVNIGTLFAFVLVAIGVLVLRRTRPDLGRPFRTPFVPLLPIASALASLWLMLNLQSTTWIRFGVWLVIGLVVLLRLLASAKPAGAGGRVGASGATTERRTPVGAGTAH